MAEQLRQQQRQQSPPPPQEGFKSLLPQKGPTTSQVLAVVTIFPLGGLLLLLAGLALTGTLIGLTVATPLFVIFSPVLVPAAFTIALAVGGFLTAGAFGLTAVSSFSWIFKYLRRVGGGFQQAERRVQDTSGDFGQKARETGQTIKSKAQETVKT